MKCPFIAFGYGSSFQFNNGKSYVTCMSVSQSWQRVSIGKSSILRSVCKSPALRNQWAWATAVCILRHSLKPVKPQACFSGFRLENDMTRTNDFNFTSKRVKLIIFFLKAMFHLWVGCRSVRINIDVSVSEKIQMEHSKKV